MRDAVFISGKFLDFDIPKEKRYLLNYFRNELQRAFLRYYMMFGDLWNFTDHTGYYCTKRLAFRLAERYKRLVDFYDKTKAMLTEESMEIIELVDRGKFPLTKIPKS